MDNIQVLERAFGILELVAEDPDIPHTISGLAERTGLKVPTVSRIVRTMTSLGYLEQVGRKTGYVLGQKTAGLSSRYRYVDPLRKVAEPLLKDFREEFGEYICLSVLRNNRRYLVCVEKSTQTIRVSSGLLPEVECPYDSVSGRVLIAGLSKDGQDQCYAYNGIPGNMWPAVSNRAEYTAELNRISRLEYLLDFGNDLAMLAFPVKKDGKTVAALGAFLPMYRFTDQRKSHIIDFMREMARKISKSI